MAPQNKIAKVKEWVDSHTSLGEQIDLALLFDPGVETDDIYVLEVVDGFGFDEPSIEKEMMETVYAGEGAFQITDGSPLHLILTSPNELNTAIDENWPSVFPIRNALLQGEYVTLLESTDAGIRLLNQLQASPIDK